MEEYRYHVQKVLDQSENSGVDFNVLVVSYLRNNSDIKYPSSVGGNNEFFSRSDWDVPCPYRILQAYQKGRVNHLKKKNC